MQERPRVRSTHSMDALKARRREKELVYCFNKSQEEGYSPEKEKCLSSYLAPQLLELSDGKVTISDMCWRGSTV